jgi:hypothetical protein
VTSAEIEPGPNSAPADESRRSGRGTDRYHGAFRRQLRAVAIGLLLVNLALGLFARQQQHATIDHSIDIFDTAFISTNYVHLAQMAFQRYVDDRVRDTEPIEVENANIFSTPCSMTWTSLLRSRTRPARAPKPRTSRPILQRSPISEWTRRR